MLVQPLLQHNQSEQTQPDPVDNVAGNAPQRVRVANDSAKLPGERRHRKKRLSRCLRRWFFPVIVGAVALTCIALGAACRLRPVHWFKSCPAVFIPLGSVVIPFAYLLLAVYLSQPSNRDLQQQSFYSTALLEELLSRRGPSSTTMYRAVNCDLETRPSMPLLVFLSDVGGTSRAWDGALDIAARQGVCAMAVQLPGSGSLRAVSFSFSRCARTVLAVLEQEFPAIGSSASASSEVTDFRSCRRGSGGRRPHSHTNNHNQPSGHVATQQQEQQREDMTWRPKVILVAHGLACRVAMYLASQHRLGQVQVVSVVLQGAPVSLVPRPLRPMERISFGAMRLPWVAEVVRRRDQKRTRHARAAHFSDMGPRPHDDENDITQTPGCSSTSAVRSLGATRLASGPRYVWKSFSR
jgi:pimeloyl-ACP methyl ester carboxylesterase